jgi:hypothetical protein
LSDLNRTTLNVYAKIAGLERFPKETDRQLSKRIFCKNMLDMMKKSDAFWKTARIGRTKFSGGESLNG